MGFSKVTYIRRPSCSAAWVTLRILLSRYSLGVSGLSAWLMTFPSAWLCAFHVSLSPLQSCLAGFSPQWQLTQSDFIAHFKVTPPPHPYMYHWDWFIWSSLKVCSLLAEKLKDPSRESVHTNSERYPSHPRELTLALRAWPDVEGDGTGFPGSRVGH